MEIKYKLYPYPVLSSYSDDYKQGAFRTTVTPSKDGYDLKLDFLADLTCHDLITLINTGKAKYVHHLECSQTGYRKALLTDQNQISYTIDHKLVCGKLQVCSFVAAVEDIAGFASNDFHDDYSGAAFDIEAGCVMAVGDMVTIDISKDIDDIANTPSIFSIIRNADASCREMLVDAGSRKIIIKLPLEDYYSYKKLSITPQYQPILNSLTVIPALTYILGNLQLMRPEERMENQDILWYKTIRKALLNFGCDMESEEFKSKNALELAQKLINSPISDAFRVLTSSFGESGGDDE